MSFILKALKKVEEEKAARRDGPAALNSAILAGEVSRAKAAPRSMKWLGIALVFIAGSGLTYLLMPQSPAPPGRVAAPGAPLPPSSVIPPGPAELSPAPVKAPLAAKTGPVRSAAVPPRQQNSPESPSATGTAAGADLSMGSRPSPDPAGSSPSGLRVNGIALQDDPAESVAVVNGALFKKGMTVEGARLEEILHDRVRFSGKDGTFEVQLSR